MNHTLDRIIQILHRTMGDDVVHVPFDEGTKIIGSFENFDSLAIVGILTAIEKEFLIEIHDDEINAEIFTSVGSLHAYVNSKID